MFRIATAAVAGAWFALAALIPLPAHAQRPSPLPGTPEAVGEGLRNIPDELLTPEGRKLKAEVLRGAQPANTTNVMPGGGTPRPGSSADSAKSLYDATEPIVPRGNADIDAVKAHAEAILALANECTGYPCPVVETCETATKLAQSLIDAEAYLDEMVGALNRAAASSAQAHNNVISQAGISSANLDRAIRVLAIREFFTNFASMMMNLASLAGDVEGMIKDGTVLPGDNLAAKLDGLYQTAKDVENVIQDGIKTGTSISGGDPDKVSATPVASLTEGLGLTPEQASRVNDFKGYASDLANAADKMRAEMKAAKEAGEKFNIKGEAGRNLAAALAKIAFTELKGISDAKIKEDKDYIDQLMKDLTAEQKILAELFLQRGRIGERRNAADDALAKVRLARAALVACLAKTCGVPTMTRPRLPDYYAPPPGMSQADLAKYHGWGTALRDLNVRLANAEIALRDRFIVKNLCTGGGGGTFTDPGRGGDIGVIPGWAGSYNRLKAACPECQPQADALSAILGELIYLDREIARLNEEFRRQEGLIEQMGKLKHQLEQLDAKRREMRESMTGLGSLVPGRSQELELMNGKRAELISERDYLRREAERIDAMKDSFKELAKRRTEVAAREPAASEALRACEERYCTPVTVDVVIGVFGHNPFNPTDPIGVIGGGTGPVTPGAPGTITLSSATYSGGEGGAVLITAVRSGGAQGIVSVGYATAPGSATPGADYAAATGRLRWESGETGGKTFVISIIDDTQVEDAETFTVVLDNVEGGASIGAPSRATVTIADNDSVAPPQPAGNLQFTSATYSVQENAGVVTVLVTRTGGSAGQVTVQALTGGGSGSASVGSDYQSTQATLVWENGDTGTKSFTVSIVNDTILEGNETFQVALNGPTGGATLGAPSVASVTIIDDDQDTGPCGPTGNAWTPNAGSPYSCGGSCSPTPTPQSVTVSGLRVTVSPFDAVGPATFTGCTATLNSDSSTLTYFGQANHRATITRTSNNSFTANIVSSGGGTCTMACSRSGP
ncbi:Calx-beta domain-containing protein [Usitatibacter palustris]|uniref:Calx-beta domain-containing protein n=1 Tax=Usitatibacter palustris TaxID=2732487 RepID=UPI00148887FB|nr:Calx-beta domain-containing protein [Usitatibacter palustris]